MKIYRGDTKSIKVTFFSDEKNTIPYDLTGFTIKMTVRTNENAPGILLHKSISEIENAGLGIAVINLTENDTKNLPAGKHIFDIEARNADNSIICTVIKSTLEVELDVSR